MSAARSSSSTSMAATCSVPSRSSKAESAPGTVPVSVATTCSTVGRCTRSICAHACAASGSTTTTLAPTVRTSRSISGAGLAGFSGTVTAPRPSAARYTSTK